MKIKVQEKEIQSFLIIGFLEFKQHLNSFQTQMSNHFQKNWQETHCKKSFQETRFKKVLKKVKAKFQNCFQKQIMKSFAFQS